MDKSVTLNVSLLERMVTNTGETILSISNEKPVLLIFLRHFGCIFCREAIKDIASKQASFREKGIQVVFVHMSDFDTASKYFTTYGIIDAVHISDPETKIYAGFGLIKGNFSQLFGLKNLIRGMEITLKGTLPGIKQIGDGFQMPGVFVIENGKITNRYIHKTASDKPDYEGITSCCPT